MTDQLALDLTPPLTPDQVTDWEWIRLNVLPPMWRNPVGIPELRTCYCQAPPSAWLGGTYAPEAWLWNRDGRKIADPNGSGLIGLWAIGRMCTRQYPAP
ncbi:hypothetical protein OG292_19155 [Streptomyces sp. NBC_01511]|uniref:hypothetical protein n=1 Tax=Streptomyces sp. NBC_01511 TaxID=2903889 RepID=UPI0038630C3B